MSLAISAQQRIHIRDGSVRGTTSEPELSRESEAPEAQRSLAKDMLLVLLVGSAFAAFYLLFKIVSIVAGLPFP